MISKSNSTNNSSRDLLLLENDFVHSQKERLASKFIKTKSAGPTPTTRPAIGPVAKGVAGGLLGRTRDFLNFASSSKAPPVQRLESDSEEESDDSDSATEPDQKNTIELNLSLVNREESAAVLNALASGSDSNSSDSDCSEEEFPKDFQLKLPSQISKQKNPPIMISKPKQKPSKQLAAISDETRLKSVTERLAEQKRQADLISSALSKNTKGSNNKKIVFASDDESDDETTAQKSRPKKVLPPKKSSAKLLGSDSDSSSGSDGEHEEDVGLSRALSRPSDVGAKLVKLQSNFAHDDRFRVNDKFLESDGSDDEGGPKGISDTLEKDRNLELLQQVMGKPFKDPIDIKKDHDPEFKGIKTIKRKGRVVGADPSTVPVIIPRYDPTAVQKNAKTIDLQKSSTTKNDQETEAAVVVNTKQYFEVKSNLKEAFGKSSKSATATKTGGGFSLNQLFGLKDSPDDKIVASTSKSLTGKTLPQSSNSKLGSKNPFKYDSSDSDDEIEEEPNVEESAETAAATAVAPRLKSSNESLPDQLLVLAAETDPRLAEGSKFYAGNLIKDSRAAWPANRLKLEGLLGRRNRYGRKLKEKEEYDEAKAAAAELGMKFDKHKRQKFLAIKYKRLNKKKNDRNKNMRTRTRQPPVKK